MSLPSHTEHLNTPRLVADASQATVWRWDQGEPFGVNAANEDADGNSVAFDLPLRLPGQYFDKETGLHYNYFREYDPSLGRYAESDPIGLVGGLNTYLYATAPLTQVDYYGLMGVSAGSGRSASGVSRFAGGAARPGTCGSGWNEPLVPDSFFGLIDFTQACGRHDDCYAVCKAKEDCDLQFRRDVGDECKKFPPGFLRGFCKTIAVDYAVAVQMFGGSAYRRAQKDCKTCR